MSGLQFHKKNREPAFAGQFYSGTKSGLDAQLAKLFDHSKKNVVSSEKLRAIISPHAGYMFSGQVAASAFNQIPPGAAYKRVFVLASSHRFLFQGAAVYRSGNYRTPLGEVKVDTKLADELSKSSEVFVNKPEAHADEHSLEVQLPFIQRKLDNGFLIVPIILGTNKPEKTKLIAEKLAPYFNDENLFVISTDFSHYPSFDDANDVDAETADAICQNQPKKLLDVLDENKKQNIPNLATSLCGWTSVLTLLYITQNTKLNFKKIEYRNSGHAEDFGEKNRVVGYWAIAITENPGDKPFQISEENQKELLKNAKKSIKNSLKKGSHQLMQPDKMGGILKESAGAFVSIYVKGDLRGCIGSFEKPDKTLNEVVQKSAVSAIKDVRFQPVAEDELEDMEIEISVLSPMKKISSVDEIELGRHGILIKQGFNSGTFLPQVANKTGWNLEQFLGRCSRDKAGIGWDGWKNAELFTYEAFVFRG